MCKDVTYIIVVAHHACDLFLRQFRVAWKVSVGVHSIESYFCSNTMDFDAFFNEQNDAGTSTSVLISVFFLCIIWREVDLKK